MSRVFSALLACLLLAFVAICLGVGGVGWLYHQQRGKEAARWKQRLAAFQTELERELGRDSAMAILNQERGRLDTPPLRWHPHLGELAHEYASDLAAGRKLDDRLMREVWPEGAERFTWAAKTSNESQRRLREMASQHAHPAASRVYEYAGFASAHGAGGVRHYVLVVAEPKSARR